MAGGFFTGRYNSIDDIPEEGSRFDSQRTQGQVRKLLIRSMNDLTKSVHQNYRNRYVYRELGTGKTDNSVWSQVLERTLFHCPWEHTSRGGEAQTYLDRGCFALDFSSQLVEAQAWRFCSYRCFKLEAYTRGKTVSASIPAKLS